MKSKVRFVLLLALVLTIAAVLSACGSKGSSNEEKPGATAIATRTQVVEKVKPTDTPTATPVKVDTPTPAKPVAKATEAAGNLKKVEASEEAMKKVLEKFDSYKAETSFDIILKLKDGSEKKIHASMMRTVVNRPEKKVEFYMKTDGIGAEGANGMHLIAIGSQAWMKMGDDSPWMNVPVSSIDEVIDSMGGLSSAGPSEIYAENSLKKGSRKFGPVKCDVYKFDKHDIVVLSKKYPEEFTDEERTSFARIEKFSGSGCVTKDGVALVSGMEMSTTNTADMGFDDQTLQEWGVTSDQVKEMVLKSSSGLVEVNKNFDIKPPQSGG